MEIYFECTEAANDNLNEEIFEKMRRGAEICLEREGIDIERSEISLTLVSEEEIRELNRDYRKNDKVTDVLSFPQFESDEEVPAFGPIVLGDVVICKDVCIRQAESFGHSFAREIVYLFVHSILHLLGYDHEIEEEKLQMRRLEEATMEQLQLKEEF